MIIKNSAVNLGYLSDASNEAIADKLVLRDENGTAKFSAPTDPEHPVRLGDLSLRENIKVTVGTGGDFPTTNEAVSYLSKFTPDFGVTAEVELMSGFVMEEQLFVEGFNLGWITITGVDEWTEINEPSLTRVLFQNNKPAFGVINGTLPTIGQVFMFSSKGDSSDSRSGVIAYRFGKATISSMCGVKNAGHTSIMALDGSTVNATYALADNAGQSGVYADGGSTVNAGGIHVDNADGFGLFARSGSTINAEGASADYTGMYGIAVQNGGIINAFGASGTLSKTKNTITADGIIFQD